VAEVVLEVPEFKFRHVAIVKECLTEPEAPTSTITKLALTYYNV